MIVDSHLHVQLARGPDLVVDELVECMDRVGIDRTCLMRVGTAQAATAGEALVTAAAEHAVRSVERYPGRFYPMLWLDPRLTAGFLEATVRRHIVDGPICGVKLSLQMNARDPRLAPLAELLQELDIPVLYHSWYKTVQKYTHESDPSDLADLASRFPGLRILVAHITGGRLRGIQDIRPHPNLFLDSSGSQPEDGYLRYGLEHLGADRVLFGSDYPGRDLATQLGRIDSVEMSGEVREKVLWRNAVRFYEGGTEDA